MKKSLLSILFWQLLVGVNAQVNFAGFVNPFIGTGGHGHTFPGPVVPFGMVQLSPDTRIDGSWDGCSGYHYSDSYIYGFSHTHLSGTGCSDYGDIAILPFDAKTSSKKFDLNYWLHLKHGFTHKNEKAEAGYYSVLMNNNIKAELTSGKRFGMHQYTFSKKNKPSIIVKLTHRDKTIESDIKMIDPTHLEGFRRSEAWAKDQHIYFVIEFSSPCVENFSHGFGGTELHGIDYATYSFPSLKGQPLVVKVGISTVSIEGARKNLQEECNHWNFDQVKQEAKKMWNSELSKIDVSSADKNKLSIFYTALYHCMIHPSLASDVDGKYRGRDNKIHETKGFDYYTVFSLWDTFRGLHPLLTIIDRKRTLDFIKTFLAQYEQGGRLPVWELSSNETDCMIGYHSVSVIADAYAKGISEFDTKLAWEAMYHSAHSNLYGLDHYNQKGFLEIKDEHESVSKTLEYAYNNWCLANFAQMANQNKLDYTLELNKSTAWKNLFDPELGFIRPRVNGGWLNPFDPFEVNNNFTEANAWQYTFFVPHDIEGLITAFGGHEKFESKLDELFNATTKTTGREQADITGLIGQYAHGNEPSHHMAYLYNYVGKPWKTQERVHQIMTDFYKNAPDGLIGNEDCGQMSAWYVLSAMGLYPVCPGIAQYDIGTPDFEKITIRLENNNTFTIKSNNFNTKNYFHASAVGTKIWHDDIMRGGEMKLDMSSEKPADLKITPSIGMAENFPNTPIIHSQGTSFKDSMLVTISPAAVGDRKLCYTYHNPYCNLDTCIHPELLYTKPFYIKNSTSIWAYYSQEKNNKPFSNYAHGSFFKIQHNYSIKLNCTYNKQYTAGGDNGLIDGIKGDVNWRKGGWQGYQKQDFECIIDLGSAKQVQEIKASFLQDTRAWIFFPTNVEFYSSSDGVEFTPFGLSPSIKFNAATDNLDPSIETARSFTKPITARYIKVKAKNFGKLPSWHQGYGMNGDDAFIFIDEIVVY